MSSWSNLTLIEQMANIGSEVIRAINWQAKNSQYAHQANLRALSLFDQTLSQKLPLSQLKEIARAKELWLDYFIGQNQYHQTALQWEKYFLAFNFAARNKSSTIVSNGPGPNPS